MKYNDNGEYKDIYVKTFDTLPVGTEVDYDGETVPTGWTEINETYNIVETGSNTYYKYIKFSDGTLIQYGEISLTPTFNTWGSLYSSDIDMSSYTFPVAFISKPVITANNTGGASGGNGWVARVGSAVGDVNNLTSPSTLTIVRPTTYAGPIFVSLIAIGRWK